MDNGDEILRFCLPLLFASFVRLFCCVLLLLYLKIEAVNQISVKNPTRCVFCLCLVLGNGLCVSVVSLSGHLLHCLPHRCDTCS